MTIKDVVYWAAQFYVHTTPVDIKETFLAPFLIICLVEAILGELELCFQNCLTVTWHGMPIRE